MSRLQQLRFVGLYLDHMVFEPRISAYDRAVASLKTLTPFAIAFDTELHYLLDFILESD